MDENEPLVSREMFLALCALELMRKNSRYTPSNVAKALVKVDELMKNPALLNHAQLGPLVAPYLDAIDE